ncbi:prephenate dehydrogenase [Conchiformibius kuhniae]|uniref:prephenate dehydrogenase n=1 Tax=Conchiformibius kuhniae TaxID=211502 RepID=A0A8T9MYD7_9NEIS|nr:prephenate dehydrogenase/arogenate dehydrogenase family protein [Conchiformibius kuhniae]UOP05426.1 prephenate dehydrogenase/arogenate dehydrogenase family protein [Conchiformibius kuhniae]
MNVSSCLNKIVLVGVGLIGGSLVLDLKRLGKVAQVVGVDVDGDNLQRALERGVIDTAQPLDAAALDGADWVLLAVPVAAMPAVCRTLAPLLPPETVVSDVGSTKRSALAAFRECLPRHFPRCVAAHPIAGSDRSGALAAQFGLYRGKKVIVCPHENQDAGCLNAVATLWRAAGAEIWQMSAEEHDAVFAAVSHLPHLLAFSYVHQLLDHPQGTHYLQFAGSGFRDFSRIAASHPQMWADIALENCDALLALLNQQQQQLNHLQNCLQTGNRAALLRYFAEARAVRENWQDSA